MNSFQFNAKYDNNQTTLITDVNNKRFDKLGQETNKMQQLKNKQVAQQEEFIATAPDFKGDGVSIWLAQDKNGNDYLRVKILNNKSVPCFKFVPKEKQE